MRGGGYSIAEAELQVLFWLAREEPVGPMAASEEQDWRQDQGRFEGGGGGMWILAFLRTNVDFRR